MPERFHVLSRRRRVTALVLMTVILGTVVFIWGNSLQSPEDSMRRSDTAEKITRPLILAVPVYSWHSDEMVTFITRKLGHFAEYFLLGAELMVLVFVLRPVYRIRGHRMFLLTVVIASADEALQLTSGRGAAVKDVLLDSCGALSGLVLLWAVMKMFEKGKEKRA